MTINTVTPELLEKVDRAIIFADVGIANLAQEYVVFNGPGYRFKVINEYDRLKRFRKGLELAAKQARKKPWSPQPVARQIAYHNSARGQREAAARLRNDFTEVCVAGVTEACENPLG